MAKRRPSKKPSASVPETTMNWSFVETVLASPLVRTVYIYGPSGIGKTYCAYTKGRLESGLFAITLTQDTPAAELRGHYLPVGTEMRWHDGPFTAALRAGGRLVVNELSHGTPEALALLYPVLESIETARMTLPTNETVRPAPGFHVICTDNAPPDELPPALQDRFDCILHVTEPHPEALARLEEPLQRAALRSIALEPERSVSLRGWLSVQRLAAEFGLHDACLATFGPDRGPQIHDAIVLGHCA